MLVGSMQTNKTIKRSKRENEDADYTKSCKIDRKTSETINAEERNKDSQQYMKTSNSRKFEKVQCNSNGKIASGRTRKHERSSH